jgi:hypothetical protein
VRQWVEGLPSGRLSRCSLSAGICLPGTACHWPPAQQASSTASSAVPSPPPPHLEHGLVGLLQRLLEIQVEGVQLEAGVQAGGCLAVAPQAQQRLALAQEGLDIAGRPLEVPAGSQASSWGACMSSGRLGRE